jgi:hypothetical protein
MHSVRAATLFVFFATAAAANIVATRRCFFEDLRNARPHGSPNFSQIVNGPKRFAIGV